MKINQFHPVGSLVYTSCNAAAARILSASISHSLTLCFVTHTHTGERACRACTYGADIVLYEMHLLCTLLLSLVHTHSVWCQVENREAAQKQLARWHFIVRVFGGNNDGLIGQRDDHSANEHAEEENNSDERWCGVSNCAFYIHVTCAMHAYALLICARCRRMPKWMAHTLYARCYLLLCAVWAIILCFAAISKCMVCFLAHFARIVFRVCVCCDDKNNFKYSLFEQVRNFTELLLLCWKMRIAKKSISMPTIRCSRQTTLTPRYV